MSTFQVGTLDLSTLTDADLKGDRNDASSGRISMLKTPGDYTFMILERKLLEGRADGAGKRWGTASILASENESGKAIRIFVDVPLESAMFTSQAGTASVVKTKIFTNLVSSVIGTQVRVADLQETVNTLGDILTPGAQFRATVKFKRDHISRIAADNFAIIQPTGETMTDENNDVLNFTSYEAAVAYYTQVKGSKPASSMEVVSFLPRKTVLKMAG